MADEQDKKDALMVQEILATPFFRRSRGAVTRLETLEDIRKNLAKVFRDGKGKKMSAPMVSALTFVLNSAAKVLKDMEGEARMKKLEEQIKELMEAKKSATVSEPAKEREPVPRKDGEK